MKKGGSLYSKWNLSMINSMIFLHNSLLQARKSGKVLSNFIDANTFDKQVSWAARHSELVTGNTRVRPGVCFGDVGYSKGSGFQNSNSARQTPRTSI